MRYSLGVMVIIPFPSPMAITIPILVNHLYLDITIICHPCYADAGVMPSGYCLQYSFIQFWFRVLVYPLLLVLCPT